MKTLRNIFMVTVVGLPLLLLIAIIETLDYLNKLIMGIICQSGRR